MLTFRRFLTVGFVWTAKTPNARVYIVAEVTTSNMVPMKIWLTIPEIAAEYAISRQTIWRLVKDRKLPSQRIGHLYRIKRVHWTTYLQKCNQEGQDQ